MGGGGGGGGGGPSFFGHNSNSLSPSLRAQRPSIPSSLRCRHHQSPAPQLLFPYRATVTAAAGMSHSRPCRTRYCLTSQPRPAQPQPLPPVSPGLCRRLPVSWSDPVSNAAPTVVSDLVHLGQLSPSPMSFSDYSHGPHSRWVPLKAPSQFQHSRAGGASPSSSSNSRASPRGASGI